MLGQMRTVESRLHFLDVALVISLECGQWWRKTYDL